MLARGPDYSNTKCRARKLKAPPTLFLSGVIFNFPGPGNFQHQGMRSVGSLIGRRCPYQVSFLLREITHFMTVWLQVLEKLPRARQTRKALRPDCLSSNSCVFPDLCQQDLEQLSGIFTQLPLALREAGGASHIHREELCPSPRVQTRGLSYC